MSTQKMRNTPFYVLLDTDRDSFGIEGGFTMELQDDTGAVITNNGAGTWSEVIRTNFNANTGAVAADANIGERFVSVDTADTVTTGDVVTIGSAGTYAVVERVGDVLELKRPLEAPIAVIDAITAVGNTGMFKAEVNADFSGDITAYVHHADYGNISVRYELVDNNIDTVASDLADVKAAIGATKTIRAVL